MHRTLPAIVAAAVVLTVLSCGSDDGPSPDAAAVDAAAAPDGATADGSLLDGGARTACGPGASCDRATQICVRDIGIVTSYRCVTVPDECADDRSCGCAGVAGCGPATTCRDVADDNTLECCPKC
jgi:hypothetical protein